MALFTLASHNNINRVEKIPQRMTLMIYVIIIYLLKDVTFYYLDFFQVLLKKKSYDKRW